MQNSDVYGILSFICQTPQAPCPLAGNAKNHPFSAKTTEKGYSFDIKGIYLTNSSHIETKTYKILIKNINKLSTIVDNNFKLMNPC